LKLRGLQTDYRLNLLLALQLRFQPNVIIRLSENATSATAIAIATQAHAGAAS
jgi:hypothetical protein